MMKKILFGLLLSCSIVSLSAQKVIDAKDNIKEMEKAKDAKEGWTKAGGLGLNLNLLNLINPRVGAGNNQIGLGGIVNYGANLVKGKILWDNKLLFQLATIKAATDPWTKATDVLQGTTQFGYKVAEKWYIAGLGDLQTQLLSTYGSNLLKKQGTTGDNSLLRGKFLAPAIFKFAPGVIYAPTKNLRILYSPFAYKGVYVTNDEIARRAEYIPRDKVTGGYLKADHQVGSELRFDYTTKFAEGKVAYTTTLDLYSNYLRTPENIDVEWYNSLDIAVFKNVGINLRSDWFYDHDILVFRGGDVNKRGLAPFIRNAVLLKYNTNF